MMSTSFSNGETKIPTPLFMPLLDVKNEDNKRLNDFMAMPSSLFNHTNTTSTSTANSNMHRCDEASLYSSHFSSPSASSSSSSTQQSRTDLLFGFNVEARRLLLALKSESSNNDSTHFVSIFNEFDCQTTLAAEILPHQSTFISDDNENLQIAYAAYFNAEKSYVKRDIPSARRYAQRALLIFLSIHGPIVKEQDDLASVLKDNRVSDYNRNDINDWLAVPSVQRYATKGQLWEAIVDCYLLSGSIEHNCESFSLAHDHFENAYLFAQKSSYQCRHLISLCLCRIENNLKRLQLPLNSSPRLESWRARFMDHNPIPEMPQMQMHPPMTVGGQPSLMPNHTISNTTSTSTASASAAVAVDSSTAFAVGMDVFSALPPPFPFDMGMGIGVMGGDFPPPIFNGSMIGNDNLMMSSTTHTEMLMHTSTATHASGNRSGNNSSSDEKKQYDCNVCGRSYSHLSSLRSHAILHSDAAYSCTLCAKKFTHKRKLTVHMQRHAGVRPFKCGALGCSKDFADKCSLVRHYRIHTNEKPFNCEYCPKRFADSTALITHTRRHHTNERPFVCPICGKSFVSSTDLNNHSPTHSTIQPYDCSLCGTKFKRKGDRTKHMKKKHPNATVDC